MSSVLGMCYRGGLATGNSGSGRRGNMKRPLPPRAPELTVTRGGDSLRQDSLGGRVLIARR
jgi:hypothetical protein